MRDRVGACATLLLVVPNKGECYVASVGAVQCVATSAMGAFASGWAQGRLLTTPHTLQYAHAAALLLDNHVLYSNDAERRRLQRPLQGAPLPAPVEALGLTRVLGMAALKPVLSAEPTVVRLPLSADTQQLALVSPGVAALASPMQCALCLHTYAQVGDGRHPPSIMHTPIICQLLFPHMHTRPRHSFARGRSRRVLQGWRWREAAHCGWRGTMRFQ